VAALAELIGPCVLAHGGVGGAIVEVLLVAAVAAVFIAIWLRERRSRSHDHETPK
jgi:hypothetical protein